MSTHHVPVRMRYLLDIQCQLSIMYHHPGLHCVMEQLLSSSPTTPLPSDSTDEKRAIVAPESDINKIVQSLCGYLFDTEDEHERNHRHIGYYESFPLHCQILDNTTHPGVTEIKTVCIHHAVCDGTIRNVQLEAIVVAVIDPDANSHKQFETRCAVAADRSIAAFVNGRTSHLSIEPIVQ